MKDCAKYEKYLWDYPDIPDDIRGELDAHLESCPDCRSALATIANIEKSRDLDRKWISSVDPQSFGDAVFAKIKHQKIGSKSTSTDRRFFIQTGVSVGLAAAIVVFMMLSIGDLGKLSILKKPAELSEKSELESYKTINLRFAPGGKVGEYKGGRDMSASDDGKLEIPKSNVSAPTIKDSISISGSLIPHEVEKKIEAESSVSGLMAQKSINLSVPEQPKAVIGNLEQLPEEEMAKSMDFKRGKLKDQSKLRAGAEIQSNEQAMLGQSFSIIEKPVVQAAPDSINIDAVYLTDEAVPYNSQMTRALISEVVVDTGMIQSARIPSSVLVTVEKMPKPLNLVTPEYPSWGRKRGLSAVVWVKARIDEEGNVTDAFISSSNVPGSGFEESAIEAAKRSTYIPAEANGIRIPVWVTYPVKYIYKKEPE